MQVHTVQVQQNALVQSQYVSSRSILSQQKFKNNLILPIITNSDFLANAQ